MTKALSFSKFKRFSASFCKFSPNEQCIAVGSASGKLRVCTYIDDYDWWGEKRLKDLTSAILSIAWTPDSCYIAVGCADRFFKIYTINPHTPKHTFSLTSPGYGFSSCVGFNSSSTHAFLYSTDSQITIFDISNVLLNSYTIFIITLGIYQLIFIPKALTKPFLNKTLGPIPETFNCPMILINLEQRNLRHVI